ncbi:MAG: flagellar hook assembly protein FlgD [Methylobacterium sp.]
MASGISGIAGTATASSTASTSSQAIAGNFQQFLTLLTTQLKNQNPLDPMDTNQFTQQLVQFAGVEQQLKTNDRLDSILTNAKASASATASSFIGKSVTADGTKTTLSDGEATWTLTPARAATKALITISDDKGNVVATKSTTLTAGANAFTWDGKGSSGLTQAAGTYAIKVDALDATGSTVAVDTTVTGTVDSVDLSGSEPVLAVGSSRLLLSTVKNLAAAGA